MITKDLIAYATMAAMPAPSLGVGPNLVMTTYHKRVATCHHALLSVLGGKVRPSNVIVVLPCAPSPELNALQKKLGITLLGVAGHALGVHDKWHHYAQDYDAPFVTIDDDTLYPRDFLASLCAAHARNPENITAHRCRTIRTRRYKNWAHTTNNYPGHDRLALGSSGVLYPRNMVKAMRESSMEFTTLCPKADDLWLKRLAFHANILVRQVNSISDEPLLIPGTMPTGLWVENQAMNDVQWEAILTPELKHELYPDYYEIR